MEASSKDFIARRGNRSRAKLISLLSRLFGKEQTI
jgi:hypothetical protein